MRRVFVPLIGVLIALVLGACHAPRTITLEEGLRGTHNGDYVLVVVTDEMVSFQSRYHKDQYYFRGALPEAELIQIQTATEQSRALGHSVELVNLQAKIMNRGR